MITKFEAIKSLVPNAELMIDANGNVNWINKELTQPTEEEIVQEIARLEYEEEVKEYQRNRAAAYPDFGTQLDYIYHNGIDAWKTDIVDPVKTAHPKQEIDEVESNSRKAQALFNYQLEEYTKAQKRLAQYQVAVGKDEVSEDIVVGQEFNEETLRYEDVIEKRILEGAIAPVEATVEVTTYDEEGSAFVSTIENPLITKDNEERAAAQAIVDATPQEVVDAYNAL